MTPFTEGPAENLSRSAESLCDPFVAALGVSGASISVFSYRGRQSTICSSDPIFARAEALQFELSEGPHWDALNTREPVIVTDLGSASESRWPMFVDGALALGIRGVFAFPMMMGAALVGVVDLYSLTVRAVDQDFIARAKLAAGRVAVASVKRAMQSAEDHASKESSMAPALRREVHQATGMIVAQLELSATDAFARLQAHAFVSGRPMDAIARDVVLGRLRFDALPEDELREGDIQEDESQHDKFQHDEYPLDEFPHDRETRKGE